MRLGECSSFVQTFALAPNMRNQREGQYVVTKVNRTVLKKKART